MIVKISLIAMSTLFAQVQPLAELGISRGFDQLFSIGIMVVFIIYMLNENKKKDAYLSNQSSDYQDLLEKNTEAINNFSRVMDSIQNVMVSHQEERKQTLSKLNENMEKMNDKLRG